MRNVTHRCIGSCIRKFGPPLVALFGRVVKLFRDGVLLKEVHQRGQDLRVYSLYPLPDLSLSLLCVDGM